MSTAPGLLPILAAFTALFLGGAVVGLGLAAGLAPGSWLAECVSLFALPVAFALGLQAWYGLALLSLVPRLLDLLRGSRSAPSGGERPTTPAIPGSFVFLPVSSAIGAVAGVVVGLASSTQPIWFVAAAYWLTGTVHGFLAWQLARRGFLLPPESL